MNDAARALWYAAGGIALVSTVLFATVVEGRVAAARREAQGVAERVGDDRRLIARSAHLRVLAAQLRRELGVAARVTERDALVRFLRDAAADVRARHVSIESVAPAPAHDPDASGLLAMPLDVTLQGRYVDLLSVLHTLSLGDVPARVEVLTLARDNAAPNDTTLEAALRVTLVTAPAGGIRPSPSTASAAPALVSLPATALRSEGSR